MKKINLVIILILFLSSCSDWLDITPKSETKEDELFTSESGFRSALWGVYVQLSQPELYGGNLTMGFLDVLAQYYDNVPPLTSHSFYRASNYEYDNSSVKYRIQTIWRKSYNAIANINNLLEHLEKVGPHFFADTNYYPVIKGEALALRAWLHFDLLRLFAPAPTEEHFYQSAIPYVDKISITPFPTLTMQQVLERCLDDLKQASDLLYLHDPYSPYYKTYTGLSINPSPDVYINDGGFLLGRNERCNYTAVRALMARIYLYEGDNENAYLLSKECIEINRGSTPTANIFYLYCAKLETISDSYFSPELSKTSILLVSPERKEAYYETALYGQIDTRLSGYFKYFEGSTVETLHKYKITYKSNPPTLKYIPMISGEEIYLINSEAADLSEVDTLGNTTKFNRLNRVRNYNGLSKSWDLYPETADYEEELFKEYRKRFIGEGQLFYFMKRKNYQQIPYAGTDMDMNEVYSMLKYLPDSEYDFGLMKK